MTPDEYARVKWIVSGALTQPEAHRSAYVLAQCGTDAALRLEAESLLAAALEAAHLFEDPILAIAGERVTAFALVDAADVTLPFIEAPLPDTAVGDGFPGTTRYAVRRRIGTGGMGIVYEVDDRTRGQVVALKTLRRRSGDDVYQLKREFRNLADVAHPNLVTLYDLVVEDEQCFFTMELIGGLTFVDFARMTPSQTEIVQRIRRTLPQLVRGVQELHRRGLQHRDIKPSNVLVTPEARVVLLDFGLTSGLLAAGLEDARVAGTPAYLPPERCLGHAWSSAGDWYSLGAMLHEALSGRVPFDGPVRTVIERKTTEDPPPLSGVAPEAPADLSDMCMSLLARDPSARPSGSQLLEWLETSGTVNPGGAEQLRTAFVGREAPLEALSAAFASVRSGHSTSAFIYGPSGIGKSALVQHFLDERLKNESVLILRSRCHEHESIPYKALDGAIDAVASSLRGRAPEDLAALLPDGAEALVRLFPVLGVLGVEPSRDPEEDPIGLQRRAFTAFRDLLARLAAEHPVVLDIDDLHWADADSIRWLTELLRAPGPRSVLTLVSFRSEELDAKPFLRSLIERMDLGERLSIPLAPLSEGEVERLVDTLLARRDEGARTPVAEIARTSGGLPFLVDALARHAAVSRESTTGITLDEMLARRLIDLPAEASPFLEALAVCGRPVLPARLFEACGLHGDERPLVARLRAAQFVRNSRTAERVEMYHDRIREALAAGVSSNATRRTHERLTEVMIAHGDDDPEALFEHYRAAGRREQAAEHAAVAAARAGAVLAFDLSAQFYQHALDLHPESKQRPAWRAALARTLENAGRPVESADAYLQAAADAPSGVQLEWRRKAAELLLIGGQIDRGLQASDEVLRAAGVRLPRQLSTAIASLTARRLQLRWRGLEFVERSASSIPEEDIRRIDVCWSISTGLAMVDPLRAADLNVRQLLYALNAGDPYRVARALALEAGFAVVQAGKYVGRTSELSRRAHELAARVGQPYMSALTSLWTGIAAYLTGQWKKAEQSSGRAVTIFQDECTGVVWELNMARNFYLGALLAQGKLREAVNYLPGLLQSARERGNFYLELELSTRMILGWLADDDPEGASRRANEAIARWSQRGFQRQHYNHLLTTVQTALYCRRANEAWQLMSRYDGAIRRSRFLRVQHTRIEAAYFHGRCAVAVAADSRDGRSLRQIARRDAGRILREDMPWANPFAHLIEATIAFQEGNLAASKSGLTTAAAGFAAADMHLYATICHERLGTLVGGDHGRSLLADAERWMALQQVRNPEAMVDMIAPGFAN